VLREHGTRPVAPEAALDDEFVLGLNGLCVRGHPLHGKVDDSGLVLVLEKAAHDKRARGVDPLAERLRHVQDVEGDVGAHLHTMSV
jgi:hypothetical protein